MRVAGLLAIVLMAASCAAGAPPIRRAKSLVAYCGYGQARPSAAASVMTSTDDRILPDRPTSEGIHKEVAAAGGVTLRWDEQLLKLPKTSATLGERDGYVRVKELDVTLVPEGSPRRRIYLLVRDHGFDRWIAMEAYDVQDVCVEGRRQP